MVDQARLDAKAAKSIFAFFAAWELCSYSSSQDFCPWAGIVTYYTSFG